MQFKIVTHNMADGQVIVVPCSNQQPVALVAVPDTTGGSFVNLSNVTYVDGATVVVVADQIGNIEAPFASLHDGIAATPADGVVAVVPAGNYVAEGAFGLTTNLSIVCLGPKALPACIIGSGLQCTFEGAQFGLAAVTCATDSAVVTWRNCGGLFAIGNLVAFDSDTNIGSCGNALLENCAVAGGTPLNASGTLFSMKGCTLAAPLNIVFIGAPGVVLLDGYSYAQWESTASTVLNGKVELLNGVFQLQTVTQQVYVSGQFGSDTDGDGHYNFPFATIARAQSSIVDATPSKIYDIIVFPGTYAENVVLNPSTRIVGFDPSNTNNPGPWPVTIIPPGGLVTLGVGFAGGTPQAAWLSNLYIAAAVLSLDFDATGSTQGSCYCTNCAFDGGSFTASTAGGASNNLGLVRCQLRGDFPQQGGKVQFVDVDIRANLNLSSTATALSFVAIGGSCTGNIGISKGAAACSADFRGFAQPFYASPPAITGACSVYAAPPFVPNVALIGGATAPLGATINTTATIAAATITVPQGGFQTKDIDLTALGCGVGNWGINPQVIDGATGLAEVLYNFTIFTPASGTPGHVELRMYNTNLTTPATASTDLHIRITGFRFS